MKPAYPDKSDSEAESSKSDVFTDSERQDSTGPKGSSDSSGSKAASKSKTEDGGRIGKIAAESKGLVEDVKEWIDLRVQLLQIEIEERIEKTANTVISVVAVLILALFAFLFLMHGLALFLAGWLGSPVWGYLSVGVLLALITVTVHYSKPRFIKRTQNEESAAKAAELPAAPEPAQLPGRTPEHSEEVQGD